MDDKTVLLNAARIDFDGKIDMRGLASQVTVYDDTPAELICQRAQGHRIVVTKEMPMPAAVIDALPSCVQLICEAGTGYNNIDLDAARRRGIAVCNIPAYSTQRVAHTVIMMLLALASSMGVQKAMLARGDHRNFTDHLAVPHTEVNGKTLGIIGAGTIGREVMRVARAMDMQILAYTRTPRPDEDGIRYVALDEVLKNCDYLSLHCPLTEDTRHMIDRRALELMKPTACVINTSRGALIDQPALIEALQQGAIAGAGLDVLEQEPPAEDCPLYTMDNVILTPHMGWKGLETRQRLVSLLAQNIRRFVDGDPINRVV